jgi:hypothetical protein
MFAVSKILGHDDKIALHRPFPWKTVDAPAKFGNSVINSEDEGLQNLSQSR